MSRLDRSSKAALLLLLATSFWGASFLLMKSLGFCQARLVPGADSWFVSSLSLVVRFGLSALVLLAWNARELRQFTQQELRQGLGLGLFGGVGILFQMDGVQYTSASTAAFLTQFYCFFVPVLLACKRRCWPSRTVIASCVMVLTGVALVADFKWRELRLGRGETETIIASILFTAQILWLERPVFAANKPQRTTLVMFAVTALVILPLVVATMESVSQVVAAYSSPATIVIALILTFASTLAACWLMNVWQPHISSTQASLIYCTEPLYTSLFALFMPAWISSLTGIAYANETITERLLIGGGLIIGANLIMLIPARPPRTKAVVPAEAAKELNS